MKIGDRGQHLEEERKTLGRLLARIAAAHGLDPEVHPGYRASRG